MPDYDEYGIPVKKQTSNVSVDEFGIPIRKKEQPKVTANDVFAKYGISTPKQAIESTKVIQPTETLKDDVVKVQAKQTEKQRTKDLLPAYENSADLYFKNNGIKPTKAQKESKVIELQREYGSGNLVLGYDKSGKPRMERELTGFDAFWTGAKEGLKKEGEARKFIDLNKDEQIKLMNNENIADSEFLPINTDYTVSGGLGMSLGQSAPVMGKAITGAVVGAGLEAVTGGTITPALPTVMSFLFSAPSAANVAYMEELKRRYYEGKQMGMSDDEAYEKASTQALVGEAKSLATDVFFSKIPVTRASGEGLNNAINQYLKSGVKTSGEFAGVSGATTLGSELSAKAQGFNKDESISDIIEKSGKDAVDAAMMGSALHIISHPEIFVTLPKYLQAQYKGYLSKADKGQLNEVLTEMVEKGMATEEGVASAQKELQSFEQAGKKVAGEFDETRENVIKGLVEKKIALEKNKSEVDNSFHDEIDQQIESVNTRIKAAQNTDNPLSVEVDNITGNSLRNVKDFPSLSNKEINAVVEVIPKEYGTAEVIEIGEGETKMYKAKASVVTDKDGLPISDNLKIDDEGKTYPSKEAAQKVADKALAEHYYENEMDEVRKPEQKSSVIVIRSEENKAPEIVENVKEKTQTEIIPEQDNAGSYAGDGFKPTEESSVTETIIPETTQDTGTKPPIPTEPNKGGVTVQQPETRITYRGLQETATEFGLEDITKREHKSDIKLRKEAEDAIKNNFDADGLVDKILKKEVKVISDVDKVILGQRLANLKDKARGIKDKFSPEYDKVFKEIERYKNAGKIIQGELGAALRDPTFGAKADDSLEGFLIQKKEANDGADLTDIQKEKTIKLHEEYEAKLQKAEALRIEAERKYNDLLAQKELNKTKGTAATSKKKTKEEYIAERTKFKDELKAAKEEHEKWLKENNIHSAGISGITLTPKMVKAISKIVSSHVNEIGSNLADVAKRVLDDVKDFIDGITEEDIRNVIAGVYNEPQKTRTQLQADLNELKTEARLINKLEEVKSGVPKTETQKRDKNARIAALDKELKGLKKETGYDDETKLKSIKARNEAQTKKIEEKIANKDYDKEQKTSLIDNPEFKTKYPKLYKEVLDGIVAREEAKHKLALDIYLDQQAKRTKGQKAVDLVSSAIATSKAMVSGIDDSFVLMQNYYAMLANPITGAKAFKEHALDAFSEKRFNRQLAALHNSKYWDTIQKSGLEVLEPQSLGEGKIEEAFDNNLLNKTIRLKNGKEIDLKKVNFLRPFERAFTSMGNNMRVKLFLDRVATLQDNGKTFESHPQEYKDAARVINEITGRGKQNKYIEIANPLVTPFIWSPRLISSGLNMLGVSDAVGALGGKKIGTEGFYRKLTPSQRKYAFSQIGRGIGVGISIMGAFALTGKQGYGWTDNEVDFDPRSVTFGNISVGDKQINVFGRLAPYVKLIVQSAMGERVKQGKVQDINEGRNPKTVGGLAGGVLRSKVTPFAGYMHDYFLNAKTDYYTKEKLELSDAPKELLVPIGLQDIKKNLERDGSLALLQFMGSFEGLQISDKRDFQKENELVDWDTIYEKNVNSKETNAGAGIKIRDKATREEREMNEEELAKFQTERDKYIKEGIDELKKNGVPDWDSKKQAVVAIPFDKLTNDQLKEPLKGIKSNATEKARELLFPETANEKREKAKAKARLEAHKKRQEH